MMLNMPKKHNLDVTDEFWKRVQLFQLQYNKNVNESLIMLIDAGLKVYNIVSVHQPTPSQIIQQREDHHNMLVAPTSAAPAVQSSQLSDSTPAVRPTGATSTKRLGRPPGSKDHLKPGNVHERLAEKKAEEEPAWVREMREKVQRERGQQQNSQSEQSPQEPQKPVEVVAAPVAT